MSQRWGLNPDYFAVDHCGLYLKAPKEIKELGFDGILGLRSLSPTKPKFTLTFSDIKRGLRDVGLRFFRFHADWINMASPVGCGTTHGASPVGCGTTHGASPEESERRKATDFYRR